MKKLLAFLLTTVLASSIVFAGSKPEVEESVKNSLTINLGQEPTTLDPGLNAGVEGSQVLIHMYEGLLSEVDRKYVPGAAESYDVSDDGMVYTFHLRDNKWSDGQPVTAYDFEFAWSRALDEKVASPYSWIYDAGGIVSFKAIDEKTFEVTLSSSNPVFLSLLPGTTFMPLREDKIDYLTGAWALDPAKVVTNGAYTMTAYTAGDKLVLTRNPTFHDAANVAIEEIVALMIVDQTTALTGYESGTIDALTAVPPAEIPRLMNEDPNFNTFANNGSNYFAFNIHREPFNDIRVRQALSYAIDRNAIVTDVQKGGQKPAHSLIPGVVMDHQGRVFNEISGNYGIPYDTSKVTEAQKLLADAGYPNGEGFPEVELLYNTNETNKALCEALQQMWKSNLGIDIKLVNMESAVFHQTRVAHDFDIARGGWYGDYPDPLTHLDLCVTDTMGNYADWSNAEYDAIIAEARLLSGAERFEKFYEADKILSESFAYMPVSHSVFISLVNSDKIKGHAVTSGGQIDFLGATIIGAE